VRAATIGICAGLSCLLFCSLRAAGGQQVVVDGVALDFPSRESLIDSSSWLQNGRRHFDLLTTDVDSVIRIRYYSVTDDGLAGLNYHTSVEGYSVEVPEFPQVPGGEVPIRRVQATRAPGIVYIVIATGRHEPGRSGLFINLHVLRSTHSEVDRVFSKEGIGSCLKVIVFRDVDGDSLPELLSVSRSGNVERLNVLLITEDGTVQDAQTVAGRTVELWDLGSTRPSVEVTEKSRNRGELCLRRTFLGRWDASFRRFVEERPEGRLSPAA
jgi:hypothetical protein